MHDIMKKKAPVQVTGGAGFRYENAIAARFLLDLLCGTNALGVDFGQVARVDWQARDTGWYADDLVITCNSASGDRTAALSIKSSQQVTRGGFPDDFAKIAWAQWLGINTERKLRDSNDALVLVTGSLAHEVKEVWSAFLHDALQTAPERMAARLSPPAADDGSQSSALRRALFESFTCPTELRSDRDTGNVAAVQLMRCVRLLHFDYEANLSRDHAQALADCQRLLRSGDAAEAERLWGCLVGVADSNRPAGGSIDLPKLLAELRGEFVLRGHPNYRRDVEVLERLSHELMADIRTEIAGLPPLPRVADRAAVHTCLDRHRACLLVGESGSGKSALAKEIGQTRYRHVI
jgi:hypothetical protein